MRGSRGAASMRLRLVLGVALIALSATAANANTVIGVEGFGSGEPCCFGSNSYGYATSVGQVITVPSDNVLQSFSFYAEGISFQAGVAAWSGGSANGVYQTGVVGPLLYQSALITGTQDLVQYSFSTGGLTLAPGGEYILFLTTDTWFKIGTVAFPINQYNSNPYTGGQLETSPDGVSWIKPAGGYGDTTFEADFSPAVPEPSTWAMLLLGFAGIGFRSARRKAKFSRFVRQ